MIQVPHPPHRIRGHTRLAGMGISTVLADGDFEAYSEAGYVWDDFKQRWSSPPGAPGTTRGLGVVGAAAYSEHPSTDVLTFAYDLKDGLGARVWVPGMRNPLDLFDYLASGGLLEAWNVAFERLIWTNVCRRRYGWPEVPLTQWRCAMAKARAHGLPGKLGIAGEVLKLDVQKDKEGGRLLKVFSMPRNPTKVDARRRHVLADLPEDADKLISYNIDDIRAEAAVSAECPDLEGDELDFWLADQAINARGVAVDREGVENCIAIIEQAHKLYNAELAELTGGEVMRASELAKLKEWLHKQGVHMDVMDEDAIDAMLKRLGEDVMDGSLDPSEIAAPYRALEIRQAVGSASVKKVFAMRLQMCSDDRLRELFSYHAARTGRPTGNGPQPTNLPKAGPKVYRCGCGRHSSNATTCTWCNAPRPPGKSGKVDSVEWGVAAAEDALAVIATRNLATVQYHFGDAMLAVSGCLRSLFQAGPGKELVSSDFTAIEAVVLAALAGENWRLEVFRKRTDIYLESISRSTGVSVEEMKQFKAERGMHHPLRQKGKVQELACLTGDALVLTSRGYVPLVEIKLEDLLWDGIQWVNHRGVVTRGLRETIDLGGIEMTPDHLVLSKGSWMEAKLLASNESIHSHALETGSANLPWSAASSHPENPTRKSRSGVLAGLTRTWSRFRAFGRALRLAAMPAQERAPSKLARCFSNTPASCPTMSTGEGFSTGSRRAETVATTQRTPDTATTAPGAFESTDLGLKTKRNSSPTSSPCLGGTTRRLSLTERTTTAATNPGICGSSPNATTSTTDAPCGNFRHGSRNLKPVYDIAHAGPRNRFTVATARGHLVVHNCGFGGWIGGMRAFGAEGTDDELKEQLLAWRAASPAIIEFWGGQSRDFGRRPGMFGLEGAAVLAVQNPGTWYAVPRLDGSLSGIKYGVEKDVLYCELPSGRFLSYHRPRLSPADKAWRGLRLSFEGYNTNPKKGPPGWQTMDLYGGLLCENVVQAVARDIQRHAIVNLEKRDYPVVLHVYDEDVCEVPIGWGSVEELETIMSTMPAWAEGWPISASGGWRHKRYQKA